MHFHIFTTFICRLKIHCAFISTMNNKFSISFLLSFRIPLIYIIEEMFYFIYMCNKSNRVNLFHTPNIKLKTITTLIELSTYFTTFLVKYFRSLILLYRGGERICKVET